MSIVAGLDGAARKIGFQTAVITTDAEAAAHIHGDVAEVAGGSGSAAHNHPVDQRRTADPGAEGEQDNVAPSASCAPQYLADQGSPRVVVGGHRKGYVADQFPKRMSLKELEVAGQAVDPRGRGI